MARKSKIGAYEGDFIRAHIGELSVPDMSQKIGQPCHCIYRYMYKHGLERPAAYLEQRAEQRNRALVIAGKGTRLKQGHASGLKGKPRKDANWAGMFTKGHRPANWAEPGTETLDEYGYLKRKLPCGVWAYVHRLVYMEHYGEIPAGMSVVFKDGDRTNIVPENLSLASRRELMQKNSIHERYSPELAGAIRAVGQLKRAINKELQKNEQKKQRDEQD
jgi:hypothetical protein